MRVFLHIGVECRHWIASTVRLDAQQRISGRLDILERFLKQNYCAAQAATGSARYCLRRCLLGNASRGDILRPFRRRNLHSIRLPAWCTRLPVGGKDFSAGQFSLETLLLLYVLEDLEIRAEDWRVLRHIANDGNRAAE